MKQYELVPTDGRKSFYNKARVVIGNDGTETLYSYGIPVIKKDPAGNITKLWHGWSMTTGRHIMSFCGLNKTGYEKLQ